jgi:hypothetical protein
MNVNPCKTARCHFSDVLDGEELPFWTRLLVRFHLRVCPPCRRFNRSLVATRDALQGLRDAPLDEELHAHPHPHDVPAASSPKGSGG